MKKIIVVIIDDDIDLAEMHKETINSFDKYLCKFIFSDPISFLETETEIDILLLDLVMPGLDGLKAINPILKKYTSISIVVNSIKDEVDVILKALQEGAVGYVDKYNFDRYIEDVLDSVSNDGAFMTPKIAKRVFDFFQKKKIIMEQLTTREKEIAQGIMNGLSYKLIALELNISIDTVRMYIRRIYRKFKINSKTELINIFKGFNDNPLI